MIPHSINKLHAVTGVLLAFCCLIGCKPARQFWTPKPGTVEYKVAQIGDKTVAEYYPKYDREKFPIRIEQRSDRWVFDYRLDDDMMGGTPTVQIDKKTFQVLKVYETQ